VSRSDRSGKKRRSGIDHDLPRALIFALTTRAPLKSY
jgi:hypothetical protein